MRAQRELGYLPRVALAEGLQRQVEWQREAFADQISVFPAPTAEPITV